MPKVGKDGVLLTAAATTIYTVPTGFVATMVVINLCNTDLGGTVYQATIHFVPSGGSPADANVVVKQAPSNALKAGVTQDYTLFQFLNSGDTIQWFADTASQVSARVSILEETV